MIQEHHTNIHVEVLKKRVLPNFVTVHKCVRNRGKEEKSLLMKGHVTTESPYYVLLLQQFSEMSTICALTAITEFLVAVLFCRATSHRRFLDSERTKLPSNPSYPTIGVYDTIICQPAQRLPFLFGSDMYTPKSATISWI